MMKDIKTTTHFPSVYSHNVQYSLVAIGLGQGMVSDPAVYDVHPTNKEGVCVCVIVRAYSTERVWVFMYTWVCGNVCACICACVCAYAYMHVFT